MPFKYGCNRKRLLLNLCFVYTRRDQRKVGTRNPSSARESQSAPGRNRASPPELSIGVSTGSSVCNSCWVRGFNDKPALPITNVMRRAV
jgi:hypothetical protein